MLCNTRVCAVTCVNGKRRRSTSRATKAFSFPPTPPLVGLFGGRRTAVGRVQNAPRRRLAVTSVASPNGVLQRFNHTTKKKFRRQLQFWLEVVRSAPHVRRPQQSSMELAAATAVCRDDAADFRFLHLQAELLLELLFPAQASPAHGPAKPGREEAI